jgi:hypothetical protein
MPNIRMGAVVLSVAYTTEDGNKMAATSVRTIVRTLSSAKGGSGNDGHGS